MRNNLARAHFKASTCLAYFSGITSLFLFKSNQALKPQRFCIHEGGANQSPAEEGQQSTATATNILSHQKTEKIFQQTKRNSCSLQKEKPMREGVVWRGKSLSRQTELKIQCVRTDVRVCVCEWFFRISMPVSEAKNISVGYM